MKHPQPALLALLLASGCGRPGDVAELLPGTHSEELVRLPSVDGSATAILVHRQRRGLGLPPEPPKTLGRWARLQVTRGSRPLYDSGDEPLNGYQTSPGFALDLAWSPDFRHLAYRHIATLRVIAPDGHATPLPIPGADSVVSSFRWIDNDNLLVVSKTGSYPGDMHGTPPMFQGYIDEARDVRIGRLSVTGAYTEIHHQSVANPTFLFHSVSFHLDEISPQADRVAFGDGPNFCIYDLRAGKRLGPITVPHRPAPKPSPKSPAWDHPIARAASEQLAARAPELEGVWWPTNDRLLVGMGLLGGPVKSFHTYDLSTGTLTDRTDRLLPVWEGSDAARNYRDPDWYRSALD